MTYVIDKTTKRESDAPLPDAAQAVAEADELSWDQGLQAIT